jgi:hypothetical protein
VTPPIHHHPPYTAPRRSQDTFEPAHCCDDARKPSSRCLSGVFDVSWVTMCDLRCG